MCFGGWNFGSLGSEECDEKEVVMNYNVNDIVVCKIKESKLVKSDEKYDDKISLKIIGIKEPTYGSTEYLVYVPEYETKRLNVEFRVSKSMVKDFKVDARFLDEFMTHIRASHVCSVDYKADGKNCGHCNEWVDGATGNQKDGSFWCRAFLLNPWR
jgi:hypothetical protein